MFMISMYAFLDSIGGGCQAHFRAPFFFNGNTTFTTCHITRTPELPVLRDRSWEPLILKHV